MISKHSPDFIANCCDIWDQFASGIVHFSRMFRYTIYTSFSGEVSDGKTPLFFVTLRTCLWLPSTVLVVYISLRIAGVYRKYFVRRSQLSRHDFMTMEYVSPHLPSSVSNCVSAVSLLTTPYTVLRLQRNSFWCLLPTCLIELRIWWTIQSWTLVLGNMLCIVSGKRLSDRQCSISVYPGHLCSEDRSEPLTRS